nr:hypothetical protein CFP56_70104 [Quercus suber]
MDDSLQGFGRRALRHGLISERKSQAQTTEYITARVGPDSKLQHDATQQSWAVSVNASWSSCALSSFCSVLQHLLAVFTVRFRIDSSDRSKLTSASHL